MSFLPLAFTLNERTGPNAVQCQHVICPDYQRPAD
jgi:hypothetical protein